jgi:ABC-type sugar transport system ATPase subunit
MKNTELGRADKARPGTLLSVIGAVKDYSGQRALDHMDFELRAGEIHALLGENGAGKSTLIKAIGGAVSLTSGAIEVSGTPVVIRSPQQAHELGISIVHQHGNLVPELSVVENVLMAGGLVRRGKLFVNWDASRAQVRELLDRVGLSDVDPRTEVDELGPHQVAMVAIAKAIANDAKIIILDEPTSALQPEEVEIVFGHMRRLAAEGIGFVFVTHRLSEVFKVSDRITVMRDGRLVGTWQTLEFTHDSLVDQLVGPEASVVDVVRTPVLLSGEPLLDVIDLRGDVLRGVNLQVRAGEVVGIASLPGEGAGELIESLYGMRRSTGAVHIAGRKRPPRSPREAIAAGFALVPKERHRQAIVADFSVRENVTLASTGTFVTDPILRLMRRGKEKARTSVVTERLSLKSSGLEAQVGTLSGGNQQKVVLGRWLLRGASIYLMDSPTAAVDVQTKSEIYALARELALDGAAVIFTSTEIEEFVRVCDRVLVLYNGEVIGELAGEANSVSAIMRLAFGSQDD